MDLLCHRLPSNHDHEAYKMAAAVVNLLDNLFYIR